MEKFKKTLRTRIAFSVLYCSFVLVLMGLGVFHTGGERVSDFISGFRLGVCLGVEFVAVLYIIKSGMALRDEEKLKRLYIKETDERIQMIRSKAGSSGMFVAMGGLMLGAIVAGYFNNVVSLTLIGASVFVSLVMVLLKVYYLKKY